jgi:DNA-binding transcriptional MerR regulator
MNLTTHQAAEKLGVTPGTVRAWGEAGVLKRTATGNGTQKKHFVYDSVTVNAVRDERKGQRKPLAELGAAAAPAEGDPSRIKVIRPPVNGAGPSLGAGITSRLDAIERKLDALLAAWS